MELMPGSSPLTRGKPMTMPRCPALMRLIPAHAGKTQSDRYPTHETRAHPRSRGENTRPASIDGWSMGSSPLTRGKQVRERVCLRPGGLIPAHAGKTVASMVSRRSMRAHPRSRGENSGSSAYASLNQGSSPLTRGKRSGLDNGHSVLGLIPAHAGKTRCAPLPRRGGRAHPRSRGENPTRLPRGGRASGSSPLTRGKPPVQERAGDAGGLIPAHAGKTPSTGACRGRWRAHPRSRGENGPGEERRIHG